MQSEQSAQRLEKKPTSPEGGLIIIGTTFAPTPKSNDDCEEMKEEEKEPTSIVVKPWEPWPIPLQHPPKSSATSQHDQQSAQKASKHDKARQPRSRSQVPEDDDSQKSLKKACELNQQNSDDCQTTYKAKSVRFHPQLKTGASVMTEEQKKLDRLASNRSVCGSRSEYASKSSV